MKSIMMMTAILLASVTYLPSQDRDPGTATVKVFGNCALCKATIENAGTKKNINKTEWDTGTQMARITYDSKKTSLDAVLKSIALAGYDNEKYLAPDDVYDKLETCCKYERKNKMPVMVMQNVPAGSTVKVNQAGHDHGAVVKTQDSSQLKTVFGNYFALKDALVRSDGNMASAKAAALLTTLEAVEMAKLDPAEHTAWMKVEKQLRMDAQHIRENKDVEHQRGHFITLSSALYELVKAAKPAETVYYQHCPMANDGKGANWLSLESNIKNPYYGSQMLTCGKTVETIRQ